MISQLLGRSSARRARVGRQLPLGTFVVLTLALAPHVKAQGNPVGRVEGVVFDSVHARPLAGARVAAVGTGGRSDVLRAATSDSAGRFHIDSLPAGQYAVGFETPLVDSLEIVLPPRAVTIDGGRSTTLRLAMPSAAKLRAALCPGVTFGVGVGVVYGHVVGAETEAPLADATVALQWRELAVWDAAGSKKLRPVTSQRSTSVTTDAGGWYRACGVPTGTWLSLQLQQGGRVGPVLRTRVDDTLGIAIRHVSLSSSAMRDTSEIAADGTTAPLVGTATLTGTVRGTSGQPVPWAEVHVQGARSTGMSDAQGSFTLSGLPAGTHELEARRIGYEIAAASVELRSGATTSSDVLMRRVVTLDSIRVVATRTRYPEFAEHQKHSLGGRFIGPEQILRRHPVRTSDLIRAFSNFVVETRGSKTLVLSSRGGSGRPCVVNIVVNGFAAWGDDPDAVTVDDVHPNEVGAIELYRQGGMAPPEYDHGCGAVAVWTKR